MTGKQTSRLPFVWVVLYCCEKQCYFVSILKNLSDQRFVEHCWDLMFLLAVVGISMAGHLTILIDSHYRK
jgi:hypothetical protein